MLIAASILPPGGAGRIRALVEGIREVRVGVWSALPPPPPSELLLLNTLESQP